MNTTNAVQVSKEEEMASMMANIVQFLQDATQLPTLRKQLEAVQAECESLKRQKEELELTLSLEREDKAKYIASSNEHAVLAQERQTRLLSLQHKFDTIQGIVAAAMEEARRDEREAQAKATREEHKPWTPAEWPPVQSQAS
jgi:septal ring factor EnvC (AmiA/AmiB activator)